MDSWVFKLFSWGNYKAISNETKLSSSSDKPLFWFGRGVGGSKIFSRINYWFFAHVKTLVKIRLLVWEFGNERGLKKGGDFFLNHDELLIWAYYEHLVKIRLLFWDLEYPNDLNYLFGLILNIWLKSDLVGRAKNVFLHLNKLLIFSCSENLVQFR